MFSRKGIWTLKSISDRQHLYQIFLETTKFWLPTLQDGASPLHLFTHSNLHKKGELNILATNSFASLHNTESLFSDKQLWAQQICRSTKIYFLTTDLRVIMATLTSCLTQRKICFLVTTHEPFAVAELHPFLITQALVTCCRKGNGSNTWRFA